jgi:hypothetical protein
MKPDAVLVPMWVKQGATASEKVLSVLAIAEPIMEVDVATEGHAYYRECGPESLLVTRGPFDSLLGAKGTAKEGQPRYRWEVRGELQVGWLIDP